MLALRAQITECLLREGFGLVAPGQAGDYRQSSFPPDPGCTKHSIFRALRIQNSCTCFQTPFTCMRIVYCYTSGMNDTFGTRPQSLHIGIDTAGQNISEVATEKYEPSSSRGSSELQLHASNCLVGRCA